MPNPLEGLISIADIAALAEKESLILDDEERLSVLEAMHSIDIQACPGSGKTTLIAAKLILLAQKWPYRHQGVCVLSHTNVAKDEIIDRIKQSSVLEAQRLLSYPHFIGTIQEFAGKYLALPFVRSSGIRVRLVDTDECVRLIYSRLSIRTRNYVDRKSQYSNVLYDFDLKQDADCLEINVPTFPNGSDSQSYRDLLNVRTTLIEEGCFFYRDIFAVARVALLKNSNLRIAIQERFPCVFIDEMQDTQKYQDELLNDIFPTDNASLVVHRFGDPDQAIFHGIGNEESNESFNGKRRDDMDYVINKSHRFDGSLAEKIRPFSFNEILLETELTDLALGDRAECHSSGDPFEHTVIVFSDETLEQVIVRFAQIVSEQFADDVLRSRKFSVKIVGAVGNEIDPDADQLKIGHYWGEYDKSKSKSNFEAGSFMGAVWYCRHLEGQDWAQSYKLLIDCILKLLRITDVRNENGRYYSATQLREKLVENGNWRRFRQALFSALNSSVPMDQDIWEGLRELIKEVCEIQNLTEEAENYLEFEEPPPNTHENDGEAQELEALNENRIRHRSGFEMQLSTIHGVKGETHDATLILETKNHTYDLETMLPYLTGELPSDDHVNSDLPQKPNSRRAFKPNKAFMRQLYVAASRPRHLLCLALHANRLAEPIEEAMLEKGWRIERL